MDSVEKVTENTPRIRAFLREVGIRPIERLDQEIEGAFGYIKGGEIIDEMNHLFDIDEADGYSDQMHSRHQADLMEYMNSIPRLSILCSSFYDWFVFRRVMERICKYESIFGNKVLDIGCGNGIITSFIARSFLESSITGMDLLHNPIQTARHIAESLHISNVCFIQTDTPPESGYDTVVSIRAMHENIDRFAYAKQAASALKAGGHLLAFERILPSRSGPDEIQTYEMAELSLMEQSDEHIECRIGDEIGSFLFAVFEHRN